MEIFPASFREKELNNFKEFLKAENCSLLIGMPGVGKSTFLRYLKQQLNKPKQKALLLDLNEVFLDEGNDIFAFIAQRLGEISPKYNLNLKGDDYEKLRNLLISIIKHKIKIILLLDRFEKVFQKLPPQELEKFRSLYQQFNGQLVYIFSTSDELFSYLNEKENDQFFTLIINTYYLKPYLLKETAWLLKSKGLNLNSEEIEKIYELTGGHSQLIKSIVSPFENNRKISVKELLENPSVKLQCERIWRIIKKEEKPILKNMSQRLINLGIIKNDKIFSQIFNEYITSAKKNEKRIWLDEKTGAFFINDEQRDDDFSENEYNLLKFFYQNSGKLVNRDQIAEVVWKTKNGVTDEAIDQLVSRLRNKIEEDQKQFKNIITIFGRGYKFIP